MVNGLQTMSNDTFPLPVFYLKRTSLKKHINTLRHWMNTLNEIMDGPASHRFAAETESIK